MATHVIKKEYIDGKKLPRHEVITWCGARLEVFDMAFVDATHALLAVESQSSLGLPCCKECLTAMRRVIDSEI